MSEKKLHTLVFRPASYIAESAHGKYTIHCVASGAYATFYTGGTAESVTSGWDDMGLTFEQCVQRCAAHADRLALAAEQPSAVRVIAFCDYEDCDQDPTHDVAGGARMCEHHAKGGT